MIRILYSILQRVKQLYVKIFLPKYGRVFMFHKICDERDEYSINKKEFERFIDYIVDKYNVVTIEEFVERKNKNDVVITFDDVYESAYQEMFDFLINKKIPFYIFVCNSLMKKDGYVSEISLKEINNYNLCYVGSHYYEHIILRGINNDEFRSLLMKSKSQIEGICYTKKINYFAFPYGSFYAVPKDKIYISSNFYSYIFTTLNTNYFGEHVLNNKGKISYIIPRININYKNYNKIK